VDTWDIFDASTLAEGKLALAANAATYAAGPLPVALQESGALMRATFDVNGKLSGVETRTITTPADETTTPRTPPVYSAWAAAPDVAKLSLTLTSPKPAIGNFTVNLDLSKATQYGTAFAVSNLTQDGYTAGDLTGVTIDESGVINTRYSNGETQSRGQLLLADFRNVQGLTQIGGGNWTESYASGQPVLGNPGEGKFGSTRAGSLEDSNVDLTGELVNMMTAQRNYQANAQTIKTQDQIMSTLVNMR
jgi:flagellar hook protein FlgE